MLLAFSRRLHTVTVPAPVALVDLVRSQQYEKAYKLLRSLDLTDIPHSRIYESAALYASQSDTTAMTMYLSLYPENDDPPTKFVDHLLGNSRIHALHQSGLILANKGYTSLVRSRILPLLSGHQALEIQWALQPSKLPEVADDDAFESSEEYLPMYSSSTHLSTDTFTPSVSALHSLLSHLDSPHSYSSARRLLLDLVALGVPIPPNPIFERPAAYALSTSLGLSEDTTRLSEFALWFTHYPPRHLNSTSRPSFPLLRPHLHSSISTSLPFYISFALLLSQKGYFSFPATHLLPAIFRFSPPSDSLDFSSQYESNIRAYSPRRLEMELGRARSLAIRFLCEAGHLDAALSLLPPADSNLALRISIHTYILLLSRLVTSQHPEKGTYIGSLQSIILTLRSTEQSPPSDNATLHALFQAELDSMAKSPTASNSTSLPLSLTLRSFSKALLSPNPSDFPTSQDLVRFFIAYISLRGSEYQTNHGSPRSGTVKRHSARNALTLLLTHTLAFSPIPYRAFSHILFAHMVLLFRLGTSSSLINASFPSAKNPVTQEWEAYTSYSLSPSPDISLRTLLRLFHTFFHLQGVSRSQFLEALHSPGSAGENPFGDDSSFEEVVDPSESDSLREQFYFSTLSSLPQFIRSASNKPSPLPLLFPTRLHLSLVWQSLAFLASTPRKLGLLFKELVRFAKPSERPSNSMEIESGSEELVEDNPTEAEVARSPYTKLTDSLPSSLQDSVTSADYPTLQTPRSWTSRGRRINQPEQATPNSEWPLHAHASPIIAECFTPFIVKLMRASMLSPSDPSNLESDAFANVIPTSFSTPTQILRTLLSLNLSPTIYHYTEMARWWAWKGEEGRVWIMLGRLEEAGLQSAEARRESDKQREKDRKLLQDLTNTDGSPNESVPSPPPPFQSSSPPLPSSDLPLYISLMRAFLSSPNYRTPNDNPAEPPPLVGSTPMISSLFPSFPLASANAVTEDFILPSSLLNPTHPDRGTRRRLRALSHLWQRMEIKFGRKHLLCELGYSRHGPEDADEAKKTEPNGYLLQVISDWRTLAGVDSEVDVMWKPEID
ncbi:hypothetical protein GYMLUDRAFT_42533 [Collybiopsis luxurians FD-317 M1]|uniref:Uncharacterized protein n=1 Tax=Collybiopsis luxurians FD-317 M1 TaxID=944289 RepID=A0A0D0C024_9AGAR|nr:hypothetical protein GYMLUDRAFT_42533 [Collybiopsis luxurians FD-317 M1]